MKLTRLKFLMSKNIKASVALAALIVSSAFLYHEIVAGLVQQWATDDNYSHGFLIVPIAIYLIWERRGQLRAAVRQPSILGIVVVLGSLAMLVAGLLGAEFFLTRISLLGTLAGTLLFVCGWQHLRILAFPLAFLLLMIPIPAIIFNQIVFPLQLLAARFGEELLLALNVPVLREGNLIVLASTTLEVTEACSGIRSLISLLTVGIIFGYFMDPRNSVRTTIALATIPIAIIANGLRIAGTGLAVQWYGPKAAEAFFHTFSGWLLFVTALSMMLVFHRLVVWIAPYEIETERGAKTRTEAGAGTENEKSTLFSPNSTETSLNIGRGSIPARTIIAAVCLMVGAIFLGQFTKAEAVAIRVPLAKLPMQIARWEGQPTLRFSDSILAVLGVDEYVSRFYSGDSRVPSLHLYVGYYQSQRQGETIHSPKNCLPGGGWQPVKSDHIKIPVGRGNLINVNRIIIQKGIEKQVVLYWYHSRGRVIASEYWAKIYLVLDAIRMNRTDGALVRVMSPVGDSEETAERQAIGFVKELFPHLEPHLPA